MMHCHMCTALSPEFLPANCLSAGMPAGMPAQACDHNALHIYMLWDYHFISCGTIFAWQRRFRHAINMVFHKKILRYSTCVNLKGIYNTTACITYGVMQPLRIVQPLRLSLKVGLQSPRWQFHGGGSLCVRMPSASTYMRMYMPTSAADLCIRRFHLFTCTCHRLFLRSVRRCTAVKMWYYDSPWQANLYLKTFSTGWQRCSTTRSATEVPAR